LIEALLPLLRGWKRVSKDVAGPYILSQGERKVLSEGEGPGWLISARATFDNPDASLVIVHRDAYGIELEKALTPRRLEEEGLEEVPNPSGMWCSNYDEVRESYTVVFAPVGWLPLTGSYKLCASAPSGSPATVSKYLDDVILIVDVASFTESLRQLFTARLIEELRRITGAPAAPGVPYYPVAPPIEEYRPLPMDPEAYRRRSEEA
jgi:hypothetical protein